MALQSPLGLPLLHCLCSCFFTFVICFGPRLFRCSTTFTRSSRLAGVGFVPLIIVISLLMLSIYLRYHGHDRSAPAACAWLLFPLAPVLLFSLFPANDMAHDRYLYIPSIGVALFLRLLFASWFPSAS